MDRPYPPKHPTPKIPPFWHTHNDLRAAAHNYQTLCQWINQHCPGENQEPLDLLKEALAFRSLIQEVAEMIVTQNLQLVSQIVDNNQHLLNRMLGHRAPDLVVSSQEDLRVIKMNLRS